MISLIITLVFVALAISAIPVSAQLRGYCSFAVTQGELIDSNAILCYMRLTKYICVACAPVKKPTKTGMSGVWDSIRVQSIDDEESALEVSGQIVGIIGNDCLLSGNRILCLHDRRLPVVNADLQNSEEYEGGRQPSSNLMGEPEIPEGVRGVPLAIGWSTLSFCLWFFAARRGHELGSPILIIAAVALMLSTLGGFFLILMYENGLI